MKIIRKVSVKMATKMLEDTATKKFAANNVVSKCLCRCSDG